MRIASNEFRTRSARRGLAAMKSLFDIRNSKFDVRTRVTVLVAVALFNSGLACPQNSQREIAQSPPTPAPADSTPSDPTAAPQSTPMSDFGRPSPTSNEPRAVAPGAPPVDPRSSELPRIDVALRVLQVRVPTAKRAATEPIWTYAREDVLDAETHRRLRENGIRVGVARTDWWEGMRTTLDGIEGREVHEIEPLRLPFGFPLGLELDDGPHDQTLFYLNSEGALTGHTWNQSRNFLRVSYTLDPARRGRVRLQIVPEVRQRKPGFDWVRTEGGYAQQPRVDGMAFDQAGFTLPLDPDEVLILAPNDNANAFGIIGGAFLTESTQERGYDRFVLIRPDTRYVDGSL